MFVVQILLPLYNNAGAPIAQANFHITRDELVATFGGLTAYTQAPVEGLWKDQPGHTTRDDLLVFEVMCDKLDRDWWGDYRQQLETRFEQESIIARAHAIDLL